MTCRFCKSNKLVKWLDLGEQPLANAFLKTKDEVEIKYPLEVYWCEECNLSQLGITIPKEILFKDYIYFSSGMPTLSDHFKSYAYTIIKRFLKNNDLVVEIGSNDGALLKFFKDTGYPILGIDPAENIAKIANENGVPTLANFFSDNLADTIVKQYGKAKIILGNNVIAHIDDQHDLARGVKNLLEKDGAFVFQAPYLVDMFENLSYDTIYHEHLSYFSIRPLQRFYEQFDLEVFDVEVTSIQGKSLRVFVGHKGEHEVSDKVRELAELELKMGLDKIESYNKLADRIAIQKEELKGKLAYLRKAGFRVAGYGVPAKGNTLLNYCEIDLEYAVEDLSSKQGLFTPGRHIPVVSADYAHQNPPDYYLMLAWNYEKTILEKEKDFKGKFIMPLDLRII